ncbi:phage holin family protein [Leucobacter sp. W1153]|uniref:phage holin family protein n=1 Tax=unclassified Leucobacter TaxID=2621730 RepID=UPI003F2E7A33
MIRFLLGVATNLVLSALALLIAGWLLPDVTLRLGGFFVAVAIFTVAQSILGPFVFNMARKYASALLGGVGLVSTFLALWVATLFSGGIQISGTSWVLAPLIVWIITALGGWIILGIVVERYLKKRERMKLVRRATK